jgi:DNA-binding MarR family transcriptional regulator
MHFVAFALKRAHRSSLALVRPWLKSSPITPARFDILHAIRWGSLYQAELCRKLGLSGATISRALKRLEELGLVIRGRIRADRRVRILELTAEGLRELRKVLEEILIPDTLRFEYELAMGAPKRTVRDRLRAMNRTLRAAAKFFGDISTLRYPTGYPNDPIRMA